MRKLYRIISSALIFFLPLVLFAENSYSVYVDSDGVMRRDDTKEEVSFYGTNYTVPFAHAYRALKTLGIDHKQAIDRDVYHLSRLGFNAFRLHLWDVEISDSEGNLLDNEHLDLLDYLLTQLEKRGISVILTAQTNFGNGYPERNIDTGAYIYDYDKCDIHENPEAQLKQARYLEALSKHVNRYTGRSYRDDRSIIAMEINNEPCHSGTSKQVTAYINKMVKALRKRGWKKPILYNVSHNPAVTDAYYKADIQGTTYQWYPSGLVAGHLRKGNFLPTVDSYDIPFKHLPGFDKKAKIVYEFDPADVLYSHLYPAVARTFRKEGFQWITQFAYDPLDMAWANTEYQTHFLNLAYTPNKAISMKIAAEVARSIPRGADFGKYPADTIFNDFRVSYREDLSELNNGTKFFYSNNTSTMPKNTAELREIAGVGSSPVVNYTGSGAYFMDRINNDTWRLEVMPDITLTEDPFEKTSLKKRVGVITHATQCITIDLPSLGSSYCFKGINTDNTLSGTATDGTIHIKPGVYLLSNSKKVLESVNPTSEFGNIRLNEYVAPEADNVTVKILHTPALAAIKGAPLEVRVKVVGNSCDIDSILFIPSDWRSKPVKMTHTDNANEYLTQINTHPENNQAEYFVTVYGKEGEMTYPGEIPGNPHDWDFISKGTYSVPCYATSDPIVIIEPDNKNSNIEIAAIPDSWGNLELKYEHNTPISSNLLILSGEASADGQQPIMFKRIAETIKSRAPISPDSELTVSIGENSGIDSLCLAIVDRDGFTYSTVQPISSAEKLISVKLTDLSLSPTTLLPAPYPSFLSRWFYPDEKTAPKSPTSWQDIEEIRIFLPGMSKGTKYSLPIKGAWITPPNQ